MRRLPFCPVPLAGALCALLVAFRAAAQPVINPATYYVATDGGLDGLRTYDTPGQYATSDGAVRAGVRTSPFTVLTAHATTDALETRATAGANMFYSFRIVGAPGTRVAATFTANLFASVAGIQRDELTFARSAFRLSTVDPEGSFYDARGADIFSGPERAVDVGNGTDRFNTPIGFIIDANAQYRVALQAAAQTETPGVVADAYLDPVLTIDPAQQGSYRLLLSPGVSNRAPTATVPEPSTWALVGAGLAAGAGVARRRRAA